MMHDANFFCETDIPVMPPPHPTSPVTVRRVAFTREREPESVGKVSETREARPSSSRFKVAR